MTGGFGVRLSSDLNFEVGLSLLNGAYDAPSGTGTTPKPDQPAFEMSLLKGFDLGGPPLLRYTLRAALLRLMTRIQMMELSSALVSRMNLSGRNSGAMTSAHLKATFSRLVIFTISNLQPKPSADLQTASLP